MDQQAKQLWNTMAMTSAVSTDGCSEPGRLAIGLQIFCDKLVYPLLAGWWLFYTRCSVALVEKNTWFAGVCRCWTSCLLTNQHSTCHVTRLFCTTLRIMLHIRIRTMLRTTIAVLVQGLLCCKYALAMHEPELYYDRIAITLLEHFCYLLYILYDKIGYSSFTLVPSSHTLPHTFIKYGCLTTFLLSLSSHSELPLVHHMSTS